MTQFTEDRIQEAVNLALLRAYQKIDDKSNHEEILHKAFDEELYDIRFLKHSKRFVDIDETSTKQEIEDLEKKLSEKYVSEDSGILNLKSQIAEIEAEIADFKPGSFKYIEGTNKKRELKFQIEILKLLKSLKSKLKSNRYEVVSFSEIVPENGAWPTFRRLADFSTIPVENPFNHKADRNAYIEACRHLFPNADAYQAGHFLTNFRKVIENVYFNMGYENLKPQQTCFYQYSSIGGTGKSEFLDKLQSFLDKKHIPVGRVNVTNQRWIGNEYSRYVVGIDNEFFPLRGSDADMKIKTINNIVDNVDYEVEYKGQNTYFTHSRVTLFFNSNRLPFDTNTRRYGIVKYNEVPYSQIPEEIRDKYFTIDWDKWFQIAFESCPFGETFEDVECKNSESLNDLIFAAKKMIENADRIPVDFTSATIREVVSAYVGLLNDGKTPPEAVRKYCFMWRNDIRRSVAQGIITPTVRINGNTDYSRYNWYDIANLSTCEDEIDNPLNDISNMWERTQKAFESFKTVETPSDPDPNKPHKLSDDWMFVNSFNIEGQKCFPKAVSQTNEMQEYVCINKPIDKSNPSRQNSTVRQENFLFEIDPPKNSDYVEEKKKAIAEFIEPFVKEFRNNILWVCDSGKKSIHIVLHTNNTNPEAREYIWNHFNEKYFKKSMDSACKNAGRLARNPNGIRVDNGKKQIALFINENAEPLDVSNLVNEFKQKQLTEKLERELLSKSHTTKSNDSIEKQFERVANSSKSPAIKLAYEIWDSGSVESGENMVGAIKAVKLLSKSNPDFENIAYEIWNICHTQHPSNIGGIFEKY